MFEFWLELKTSGTTKTKPSVRKCFCVHDGSFGKLVSYNPEYGFWDGCQIDTIVSPSLPYTLAIPLVP